MSSTRSILRLLTERIVDPAALLEHLNKILLRDFPRSRFVTVAYVLLDPSDLTARIALAGHPPPVLIAGAPACSRVPVVYRLECWTRVMRSSGLL